MKTLRWVFIALVTIGMALGILTVFAFFASIVVSVVVAIGGLFV